MERRSFTDFLKSRRRELALAIFSAILGLVLSLTAVETYFWIKGGEEWVAPHTVFDPELGWANVKNKSTTYNGKTYTANSLGFRSGEIDPSKKHILVVGDSVAFGVGVNDDETVSYYLGELYPKLQVLNLAVAGYGIDQYYLTLRKHIRKTHPQYIVVVIYTVNDLTDTRFDNMFGIGKPLFIIDAFRLRRTSDGVSRFSCGNLLTKSWILKKLSLDKLRDDLCGMKMLPEESAKQAIAVLLDKINNLALQYDAKLVFVLSPSMTAVEASRCMLQGYPGHCRNLDFGYYWHYLFFNLIFDRSDFDFIDYNNDLLLASQDADISRFYNRSGEDIHHYSPLGNEHLAQVIASHLKRN